jgi:hypothetical protein
LLEKEGSRIGTSIISVSRKYDDYPALLPCEDGMLCSVPLLIPRAKRDRFVLKRDRKTRIWALADDVPTELTWPRISATAPKSCAPACQQLLSASSTGEC